MDTSLFTKELTPSDFLESYDWKYIFENAGYPKPVLGEDPKAVNALIYLQDVTEILALVEGENDGADWVGVFKLADGRYLSISAGCDYTGWG